MVADIGIVEVGHECSVPRYSGLRHSGRFDPLLKYKWYAVYGLWFYAVHIYNVCYMCMHGYGSLNFKWTTIEIGGWSDGSNNAGHNAWGSLTVLFVFCLYLLMYLALKCNFYGKHKRMNAIVISIICLLRYHVFMLFFCYWNGKQLHQTPLLYLI